MPDGLIRNIPEPNFGTRRDDVFSKVVMRREVDPAVLRALTVHEAVRSGLLSSEDTVRLLHAEPPRGERNLNFRRIDRSDRFGTLPAGPSGGGKSSSSSGSDGSGSKAGM